MLPCYIKLIFCGTSLSYLKGCSFTKQRDGILSQAKLLDREYTSVASHKCLLQRLCNVREYECCMWPRIMLFLHFVLLNWWPLMWVFQNPRNPTSLDQHLTRGCDERRREWWREIRCTVHIVEVPSVLLHSPPALPSSHPLLSHTSHMHTCSTFLQLVLKNTCPLPIALTDPMIATELELTHLHEEMPAVSSGMGVANCEVLSCDHCFSRCCVLTRVTLVSGKSNQVGVSHDVVTWWSHDH